MAKRKPTQTVQAGTRMPESLRARLDKSADARGASLNSEIVHRLEESFRQEAADKMLSTAQAFLDEAKRISDESSNVIDEIERELRARITDAASVARLDEVFLPNAFFRKHRLAAGK